MNAKKHNKGLTILEMVLAIGIIAAIFAAILPQFVNINNSWASRQENLETLQVERILTSHLRDRVAVAKGIIAVSDPGDDDGFLEYDDIDGTTYRYEISGGDLVFGPVGNMATLAESVSELKFKCYALDDLDDETTDVDDIRFVEVEIEIDEPSGRSETVAISVYLRTGFSEIPESVGMWKLDEAFGFTAADSSGNDFHGTLINMVGNEWTTGIFGGALALDGFNDYVLLPITGDYATNLTFSAWFRSDDAGSIADNYAAQRLVGQPRSSSYSRIALGINDDKVAAYWHDGWDNSGEGVTVLTAGSMSPGLWYHAALTYDGTTIRIYLDGKEENSFSENNLTAPTTSYNMQLGHQISGKRCFNGALDAVSIYNRTLTPDEIEALASAVKYRGFAEAKIAADTTSIIIPTPGGIDMGDLLIAAVATDGNTSASLKAPPGEGWWKINTGNYLGRVSLGAWWKLADPSESTDHEFRWSGAEQAYGWMMRFTGHDPASPINSYTYGDSSSPAPTSPSVTTNVENALILRLGAFDGSSIIRDAPGLAGHTAITMDNSDASGIYGISVWDTIEVKDDALIDIASGIGIISTNSTDKDKVKIKNRGIIKSDIYVGPGGDPGKVIKIDSGALHDGNTGILTAEVTIPSIVEPSLGSSVGDVTFSSGTTTINKDFHCNKLTIKKSAIVRIKGYITVLADSDVLIDGDAEIQMLAGGTLNLYGKTKILFKGNAKANVNTGDPARFKIYHIGSGKGSNTEFHGKSVVYAKGLGPDSKEYKVKDNSEVFGTYRGKKVKVEHFAKFHIDFGSSVFGGGSGNPVSGGAGYVNRSFSGPSGVSTFSLTASEESRMITVGIAQDPASGGALLP